MITITEQLHKVIDELEADINRDKFATLIFKIKDNKFIRFEKQFSVNLDELKVEITE